MYRELCSHTHKHTLLIDSGEMAKVEYATSPVFNLQVPKSCPNVPPEVLNPENVWADKDAYKATVAKLAGLFTENFKNYSSQASAEVLAAGPKL